MQSDWPAIELTTLHGARAMLFEHGAHLTQWQSSSGKHWVFTSREAVFKEGKAIRGGVPVIFPQFNQMGSGPKHGFLRNMKWRLQQPVTQTEQGSECTLTLVSSEATRALWPHEFAAQFHVELGETALAMTLHIRNTGDEPFSFTAALHTYFQVSDFYQARLNCFKPCQFWDNGTPFTQRQTFTQDELTFDGPLDRVYFDLPQALQLHDGGKCLEIAQQGFRDVVVWNPGPQGARDLADMADDEFQQMLCVEAASIDCPVTLGPGEAWRGAQLLTELN